uniref:Uncharacterized protein n=1 Tax=Anguilla anguilla TaxID=7936 RepID=A0A0E9QJH1_ANGAN
MNMHWCVSADGESIQTSSFQGLSNCGSLMCLQYYNDTSTTYSYVLK